MQDPRPDARLARPREHLRSPQLLPPGGDPGNPRSLPRRRLRRGRDQHLRRQRDRSGRGGDGRSRLREQRRRRTDRPPRLRQVRNRRPTALRHRLDRAGNQAAHAGHDDVGDDARQLSRAGARASRWRGGRPAHRDAARHAGDQVRHRRREQRDGRSGAGGAPRADHGAGLVRHQQWPADVDRLGCQRAGGDFPALR